MPTKRKGAVTRPYSADFQKSLEPVTSLTSAMGRLIREETLRRLAETKARYQRALRRGPRTGA